MDWGTIISTLFTTRVYDQCNTLKLPECVLELQSL